ncbi:MAG TPA: HAMP domain-containing sensor histidine kinase [Trebonia sp.]|nr:HAMP domain-containing sensor histidine kinase [Trebonia sp.]
MSGADIRADHLDTEPPGPDHLDTDHQDTGPPGPPWRPRDERRGQFLRSISARTPLRTKLITAVLLLVILALAAISVASVTMLRGYVTTQQDNNLKAAFYPNFNNGTLPTLGSGPHAQSIQAGYAYSTNSDLIVALQQPGSQVSWYTANFPGGNQAPLPQLPTNHNWASSPNGVLRTVPAQSGPDSWRVIAGTTNYTFIDPTGAQQQTLTLVFAVDLGDLNAMTHRLILFDLIVGGAIVLVLAAVGIAVVQANLRPLNDIELTASQIAKGHLNHRIPERDPRTEIGSLGHSLNAMLSQIETAFHAQEESEQAAHRSEDRMRRFIADASHELRTPLTTIRGFAEYYRQRGGVRKDQDQVSGTSPADSTAPDGTAADGLTPQDLDRIMRRLEAEASRMGLLVEDLLTLARLDQQRPLNIAPVDLLALAGDAVQDARMVAPGRPIDLSVAPGAAFLVDGDEARLRQVIGNLLNNALTHTPPDTPVRVKIASGMLDHATPAVVLDVEDDGPGMERDQAQRVFERFYRADQARNRASGGTGLGLAIVSGLVAAHGGTVSVRTAPGEGADFQVRLPLSPGARVGEPGDADDGDSPASAQ